MSEVVRIQEVGEVAAKLIVGAVVEAFDGGVFDRLVHPLDLAVGPWTIGFCQPVFDPIGFADHVEAHLPRKGGVPVARLIGELDAAHHRARIDGSLGRDRVDAARNGFQKVLRELPCGPPVGLLDQLGNRELAGPVVAGAQACFDFGGIRGCDWSALCLAASQRSRAILGKLR